MDSTGVTCTSATEPADGGLARPLVLDAPRKLTCLGRRPHGNGAYWAAITPPAQAPERLRECLPHRQTTLATCGYSLCHGQ